MPTPHLGAYDARRRTFQCAFGRAVAADATYSLDASARTPPPPRVLQNFEPLWLALENTIFADHLRAL
jgi:hypothetical protein